MTKEIIPQSEWWNGEGEADGQSFSFAEYADAIIQVWSVPADDARKRAANLIKSFRFYSVETLVPALSQQITRANTLLTTELVKLGIQYISIPGPERLPREFSWMKEAVLYWSFVEGRLVLQDICGVNRGFVDLRGDIARSGTPGKPLGKLLPVPRP